MEAFHEWTTFSQTGVPLTEISLDFALDPHRVLSEEAIAAVEAVGEESTQSWFEAVNLCAARNDRLELAPIPFEYYLARQELLTTAETRARHGVSQSVVEQLRREIRALSSITAIVVDDHLLLGVRPPEWRASYPTLSAPGGGYLDYERDFPNAPERFPRDAVLREVTEETGITAADVTDVRAFGVYEETADGSDRNPAVFSRLSVARSRDDVEAFWREAPDNDEFEQLLWVPLRPDVVVRTLRAATSTRDVPDVLSDQVELESDRWRFTPKTALLVFLLGRARFESDVRSELQRQVAFE